MTFENKNVSNSFVGDSDDQFILHELSNMEHECNTNEKLFERQEHESINNEITSLKSNEVENFKLDEENINKVKLILEGWNLGHLLNALISECIDVDALSHMKSKHIDKLLSNYSLGTQIKLENHLITRQNTLNVTKNKHNVSKQLITTANKNDLIKFVDIHSILTKSTEGLLVLDYYKEHNELNDSIRGKLVDIIIHYLFSNDFTMSVKLAESIADQINFLFPSEIKDIYFMRSFKNSTPRGKLYTKFYNNMRSLKTSGLIEKNNKNINLNNFSTDNFIIEPEEEDIRDIIDIIKYDHLNIPFTKLQEYWGATVNFRLKKIREAKETNEIINEWASYRLPLGYKLVDIDFKQLIKYNSMMVDSFDDSYQDIMNIIEKHNKDRDSKILVEQLSQRSDICQSGKNTAFFYLLSSLFVPTSRKVTRDENGKKNIIKYSIKDSQNSLISFHETVDQAEAYIALLQSRNQPIQPFILIIGTILKPRDILLYFDAIKIPTSIMRCLDIYSTILLQIIFKERLLPSNSKTSAT
ncbi:uncharacterized protein LOC126902218 isoform X3 [Daktulosphaira vitifoliae]|uniref:uncharacterized protein LOC126902218 isoform X3 n=2 Tax=Daktulosphaira vitifoliae TaxID=58002 RepID=UPI0021A9D491|nr:uncharacterized protein LOC126902218 isoform X3 [Daktulosphaira vitifoliae]